MSHLYDQSPLGKGFSGDLFGRLKVSNPYTLFDSIHRYNLDGDFSDVIVGSGSTVGFVTARAESVLTIGSTEGCYAIRESKRVFSYQPGKSLQTFQTFIFNEPKENVIQRVGYAGSTNGVMLELDGTQVNIIKRTSISGVGTTISVPQSEWNLDTLDGNGPSGFTLDPSKIQILFTEFEWLGAGSVRVGFAIDGKFVIAHQFNHANLIDSVYMTSATLPIRYELINKANVGSASTLKQVCTTVQVNGGYERKVSHTVIRRGSAKTGIGLTFTPLISYKLSPGKEDAVVVFHDYQALPLSNNIQYEVVLLKNANLVGAAYSQSQSPNVSYDTSATGLTGGEVMDSTYVAGSNQASGAIQSISDYNWDLQLGRTQSKVSDVYTLAARTLSGSGDIIGAISFFDFTF